MTTDWPKYLVWLGIGLLLVAFWIGAWFVFVWWWS